MGALSSNDECCADSSLKRRFRIKSMQLGDSWRNSMIVIFIQSGYD